MAKTLISDIIVPEVFNAYVTEKTATVSNLFKSGIIEADSSIDTLAASGGRILNMPYFKDLTGADEVLDDGNPLSPDRIQAGIDKAILLTRGKAWSVNALAAALSGADPLAAIGDLVAEYWARQMQTTLIKILSGVFGAASMSANVLDISGETTTDAIISATTFVDALQKLADNKDKIVAVAFHSAVVSLLTKADLIETIPDSEGKPSLKTFMGKIVIEDDSMPIINTDHYVSYLFGRGAIAYGAGAPQNAVETDRDSLADDDILINRKHYILHPRGVAFQDDTCVLSSPSNVELAISANWVRAYEAKNIRIIKFVHQIVSN